MVKKHDGHGQWSMDNLGFNCGISGTGMTRSLMRRKKRRGGKRKKTKMTPYVRREPAISV